MSLSRYVARRFIRQLTTKPSLDLKRKATDTPFSIKYISAPIGKRKYKKKKTLSSFILLTFILTIHISIMFFLVLLFLGRNFTPLTMATGLLMAVLYQHAKDKAREKEMEELHDRFRLLEE